METENIGKILVVDDVLENRKLLAAIITKNTSYNVALAKDGEAALTLLKKSDDELPDLILLDIMMPNLSGYQVAEQLKSGVKTRDIPIIFLTALSDIGSKIKAFEMGGVDYISKPFNKYELLARISSQMKLKFFYDQIKLKNKMLEDKEIHLTYLVEEKTQKLQKMTLAMVTALENANLFNDDDTGNHIRRVSEHSAILAEGYGCSFDFIKKIRLYASLHDVGKVGIPDAILKKPGRYTVEEFKIMKAHVDIGVRMLSNNEIDDMARNIVRYHHEKWDGSGYLKGLKGENIPLEARIVSLADVYDALVTKRVYKNAFSEEEADRIIREGSGTHFDPKLVEVFFKNKDKIIAIKKKLSK